MAVLSLCKRGMGTPAKSLAFCDNEEKSKSLFRCGVCTGRSQWLLKKKELDQWLPRAEEAHAKSPEANLTDLMK